MAKTAAHGMTIIAAEEKVQEFSHEEKKRPQQEKEGLWMRPLHIILITVLHFISFFLALP